jgi:hypothetical protein
MWSSAEAKFQFANFNPAVDFGAMSLRGENYYWNKYKYFYSLVANKKCDQLRTRVLFLNMHPGRATPFYSYGIRKGVEQHSLSEESWMFRAFVCRTYVYARVRRFPAWKSPFFRWIYVYLLAASALPQVLPATFCILPTHSTISFEHYILPWYV